MPPAPQPFDIPCDCGEHLTGWRTDVHQKLNCITCDRPLLVLPNNVYPVVKRTQTAPIRKPPGGAAEDSSAVSETNLHEAPPRKSKKSKGKEAAPAAEKARPDPVAEAERINLAAALQQAQTRRRRLRLVVVSILALVAVTGWSLWSRTQRDQARTLIPLAAESGLAALRAGEFAKAERELAAAARALDTLHRNDPAAQTIRQAWREAVAAHGLTLRSLEQLGAEMLSGTGTSEDRQRRFQAEHGSEWLIFDVGVVPRSHDGVTVYELDVPLAVREQTLQVVCDFPDLKRVAGQEAGHNPVRVIFAAQLGDWLIPEASAARPLVARIKPASAFLWSDYDSYLAVGYQSDSPETERETRALLSRQRHWETTP